MVRQRDATGLAAFDQRVHTLIRPASTRAHLARLFATLEGIATGPAPAATETGVAAALHDVAERLPRRGLVILLSDLFDSEGDPRAVVRALQHLRHRGHEVVVFHILDAATELRFALPDAPVRVRDLETGAEQTILPAQIRSEVVASAEAFVSAMRQRLPRGARRLRAPRHSRTLRRRPPCVPRRTPSPLLSAKILPLHVAAA